MGDFSFMKGDPNEKNTSKTRVSYETDAVYSQICPKNI